MVAQASEYARTHDGGNLFDDLVAAELRAGTRIVTANEHWIVFVPEAARWPYEVRIFPTTRVPDLTGVGAAARDAFGPLYLDVLRRFDALFGRPAPYIAAWHQAPVRDSDTRRQFAAHLQVLSVRRSADKLKYLAGTESGMGVWINDIVPEEAARTAQGGLMKVLVTGGAGYIGSVVAAQLIAAGHEVTVLDDLSTGFADAVPPGATFVKGTLRDCAAEVLSDGIEAVLHFAAKSLVGESVADPAKYWSNNLGGTVALLEAMREMRIRTIVFSSTAAVYGEPERTPVTETDPTRPTSPYGASKIAVDTTLTEFSRMYGFGAVSLRYFNVAGAHQAPTAAGSASGTTRKPTSSPTCWPA